jgi:amino acid transporter
MFIKELLWATPRQDEAPRLSILTQPMNEEDELLFQRISGDDSLFEFDNSIPALSLELSLQKSEMELPKHLGYTAGFSLIVGNIIGSGIFASPGPVLKYSGSVGASLCVWIAAGFLAMTGGLCYGELGTMIAESGGDHPYLLRAFGELPAFLFSWSTVLASRPGSIAIIITTCSQYIVKLLIAKEEEWLVKVVSFVLLGLLTIINSVSSRAATNTQTLTVVVKVAALCTIGGIGMVVLLQKGSKAEALFENSSPSLGSSALALYSALWAYDGWNALNTVAGEVKNPDSTIPKSIISGTGIVIILYIVTNISYAIVLPLSVLETSGTVALDFGEAVFGSAGKFALALAVIISTLGAANGSIFTGARVSFVAAQKGLAPNFLGNINQTTQTPLNSILLQSLFTSFFVLIGNFKKLVNVYSVVTWTWYFLTVFGLLVLRLKEPYAIRPFKIWILVPIVFCLESLLLLGFSVFEAPYEAAIAAIFILFGIPIYYIQKSNANQSSEYTELELTRI